MQRLLAIIGPLYCAPSALHIELVSESFFLWGQIASSMSRVLIKSNQMEYIVKEIYYSLLIPVHLI